MKLISGRCAAFLLQIAFFVCISELAHAAVDALSLPLPGNLLGMLALLAALATGLVPPRFVQLGSSVLVRHLAFFFVPIAVGLMGYAALFRESGFVILFVLVVSAGIGIGAAGLVSQRLARKDGTSLQAPHA